MIKKRMKIIAIVGLIFICIFCAICAMCHILNDGSAKYEQYVSAKIDIYDTLSEISADADLIVKGIKISENAPVISRDSNGHITGIYTISTIRISSVEKGMPSMKFVNVLENQGYDDKTKTIYHIAGYEKMTEGNEYILILRKADGNDWYVPVGVNVGKIPINEDEKLIYTNDKSELSYTTEMIDKARKEYD